ncbi:MAG: hypothetical protein ABFS22_09650 [Pseudomonadota bacterium]
MAKTVGISVNAIVATTLLVVVSCGFILFQKSQYDALMQDYVDIKWQQSTDAANLVMARRSLDNCKQETESETTTQ